MTLEEKSLKFENGLELLEKRYENYFSQLKEEDGRTLKLKNNIVIYRGYGGIFNFGNLEHLHIPKFIKEEIAELHNSIFQTSQDSH